MVFKGKTVVVTGGSRGIGHAIALRFATAEANIVILTKDTPMHLEEVILQMQEAGGSALVLDIDVCDPRAIKQAIALSVQRFGGIDVLVNNTSATCFTDALHTSPEQFDLIIGTSARAAFFLTQACAPHLKNTENPHIINISPPLHMDPHWFENHLAFSIGKYAMSMCTLGMAREFQEAGIAVNSLWPRSTIATQTIKEHFSEKVFHGSRWPTIMADAAFALVLRKSRECTGQFFTDEILLRETGMIDFSHYAVDPSIPLMQALFVPKENTMTRVSQDLFLLNLCKES